MLIVAIASYLSTMEMDENPCKKRYYNNYFGGLFHDLPEVLTKDIISPVKRVADLDEVIKEYENQKMKEKLLPLLPKPWHDEMRYFTENEFGDKILVDDEVKIIRIIEDKYNKNEFSPLDGNLIKACDKFSALYRSFIIYKTWNKI